MTRSQNQRPTFWQRLFGPPPIAHPYAAPTPDAHVTPAPSRCVQCGVCGYNCPVGIPVREYARQGLMVDDLRCVQCGQCVEVCPRGTLRWSRGAAEHLNTDPATEYAELLLLFPVEAQAPE